MANNFSPSIEDAVSMTHQAEPPNPAAPWIERAKRFYSGGLADVLAKENRIPQSLNENWLARQLRSRGLADAMQTWNPLIEAFVPIGPGARMGWPDIGQPKELSQAANINLSWRERTPQLAGRYDALTKLIQNRDFLPIHTRDGRIWFRTLTREENEQLQKMGWSRAPGVTFQDEIGGLDFGASETEQNRRRAWAWEKNVRHWLSLSTPKE